MESMKVHMAVSYIQTMRFEHEIVEVEEKLREILLNYGIEDGFTSEELAMIKNELSKLAEQFEFNEAAYLALQNEDFDF
jgi:hypothetical protein